MSEISRPILDRLVNPKIAGALAGVSLMGAGFSGIRPADASNAAKRPAPLERCYDSPNRAYIMPDVPMNNAKYNKWNKKWGKVLDTEVDSKPIHLQATPKGVVGDPGDLAPAVDRKLARALVKVSIPDFYGSGVLTHDAHGDEVVLTAAHVTANTPINKISVSNAEGKTTHVLGGCYIFENQGRFISFGADHFEDLDLAVLKLARPIGGAALDLAATQPERGDWVFFKNYQMWTPIKSPATYAGIVTTDIAQTMEFNALTGLQFWRGKNYALRGGASGGPVVNENGELVGISTASDFEVYEGKKYLHDVDAVTISGLAVGRKTKLMPIDTFLMHENALEYALASPRA